MCSVTHEVRAHVGWMEGEVVEGPDQREKRAWRMCRRWQELKEERPSAWRIPGTGEPGGLPSMGSRRVGHD